MGHPQLLVFFCYACLAVGILGVAGRCVRITRLPRHLRWELYPVAHEGARAKYGGSYFEELDWWKKPREASLLGELKVMVPEILLLAGVRHKNPSHWLRSFPFHFGLYLVGGTTVLLVAGGIAAALGSAQGLGSFLGAVTACLGYAGFSLGLLGAVLLLARRLFTPAYREYTTPADFLNLFLFVAAMAVGLAAQLSQDPSFDRTRAFFAALVTFGSGSHAAGLHLAPLQSVEVLLLALLVAYVPLTHMSHFFTKWFLSHDIRGGDEPMAAGTKLEADVNKCLGYRPTWAARHMGADGKRTWVDVATSKGFDEEKKEN
jgi:nitrate reductase gamma subunit